MPKKKEKYKTPFMKVDLVRPKPGVIAGPRYKLSVKGISERYHIRKKKRFVLQSTGSMEELQERQNIQ